MGDEEEDSDEDEEEKEKKGDGDEDNNNYYYYSCSPNATTEPTSVTQDSTDTIERKASILQPNISQGSAQVS